MSLTDRIRAAENEATPAEPERVQPYVSLLKEFVGLLKDKHRGNVEFTVRRTPLVGGYEVLAWPALQPKERHPLFVIYPDDEGGVGIGQRRLQRPEDLEDWLLGYWESGELADAVAVLSELADAEVEGALLLPSGTGGTRGAFRVVMDNADFRRVAAAAEGAEFSCKAKVARYQFNGQVVPPADDEPCSADFAGYKLDVAKVAANPGVGTDGWTWLLHGVRGRGPSTPRLGRRPTRPA